MASKSSGKRKTSKRGATIAVIGARSSQGGELIASLAARGRDSIVAIDLVKPDPFPSERARFHKVDITDALADESLVNIFNREGVEVVVHALSPDEPGHRPDREHEWMSIGTMHLLHACASAKIKRLVLLSSTMVYGASPKNPNFLTEDMPLAADPQYSFVRDMIDIEKQVARFSRRYADIETTVLRFAPIIGPGVRNIFTRYFRLPVIPTVLGYNPLMQVVHEEDAIQAVLHTLDRSAPGIFNIVGHGVLPLLTIVKFCGRVHLPVLSPLASTAANLTWLLQVSKIPREHLDYVRYLFVAAGEKAAEELGWQARYSIQETFESMMGVVRLREQIGRSVRASAEEI